VKQLLPARPADADADDAGNFLFFMPKRISDSAEKYNRQKRYFL
jgi:hypothetical protein